MLLQLQQAQLLHPNTDKHLHHFNGGYGCNIMGGEQGTCSCQIATRKAVDPQRIGSIAASGPDGLLYQGLIEYHEGLIAIHLSRLQKMDSYEKHLRRDEGFR
jgi:hypothetical protein